jgi:hypothetical protein
MKDKIFIILVFWGAIFSLLALILHFFKTGGIYVLPIASCLFILDAVLNPDKYKIEKTKENTESDNGKKKEETKDKTNTEQKYKTVDGYTEYLSNERQTLIININKQIARKKEEEGEIQKKRWEEKQKERLERARNSQPITQEGIDIIMNMININSKIIKYDLSILTKNVVYNKVDIIDKIIENQNTNKATAESVFKLMIEDKAIRKSFDDVNLYVINY